MARSTDETLPADPFLFDAEQLNELASTQIVRRGIGYFKENRVTDLGWNDERLWASVDGSQPGGYQVELSRDEEGELVVECDCPFDWEPACKHAVAVLLAYAARRPVSEAREKGAAEEAREARMQRARSEVKVKHVSGDRWLGRWEARSLASAADGRPPWRVEFRSVSDAINHCTCPDFAVNRLGTCKHIEAVRHDLRKRAPRKFEHHARMGPPTSIVHLEWEESDAPRVRMRPANGGAPAWLREYFEPDGFLRGSLPDAFPRLLSATRDRTDVVITPEVGEHVRRLEREAERRARAQTVGEAIRASGGTLPGVAARLYPYQVEGVAFLATAGRALLADDMGLGKTLQAIAAAAVMRERGGVRRALVVCPASLKHQWAREVERFTGVEGVVVQGSPSDRLALYRKRAPFTMVNYEIVIRDGDRIQAELSPDLLILDEAQRLKNWRTKTAAAVKSLETPFAFVLTGTPLENRLEDLYSLMQVVDPRVLGPLWRYLLDFHVTDERGGVLGYRNLAQLRRRLAPVMLRRDLAVVRSQLPERIETRFDLELDRRQRDLHDEAMAAAGSFARIAEKRPLTPSEEKRLLAALQNARMACNAAGLVDGETVGSPKLTELKNLLEDLCVEGGRKAVVFSQWEKMTRMAEEVAQSLGLGVIRLHGGVPTPRRGTLIDRFRQDPGAQVFISTDAGGVGLNLQAADVLINLDLPWNPAVLGQRIGRVHRLGQTNPVQVVLMVARDSYEERIDGLIGAKRHLFRNVVDETAEEEVVGVSKKMVEAALATLAEQESSGPAKDGDPDQDGDRDDVADEETRMSPPPTAAVAHPEDEDPSLAPLLTRIQASLGDHVERIVAVGGGLVVVVDVVDPSVDAVVESWDSEVPVAVVDSRNWASLSRMGPASPLASGRVVAGSGAADTPPPDHGAVRKLRAAEALAEAGHDEEALSLATTAMLLAAAGKAGKAPPSRDRAAVWLHGELVPGGIVAPEQAASISRGLALAAAGEVPRELVATVLDDARTLLRELG